MTRYGAYPLDGPVITGPALTGYELMGPAVTGPLRRDTIETGGWVREGLLGRREEEVLEEKGKGLRVRVEMYSVSNTMYPLASPLFRINISPQEVKASLLNAYDHIWRVPR